MSEGGFSQKSLDLLPKIQVLFVFFYLDKNDFYTTFTHQAQISIFPFEKLGELKKTLFVGDFFSIFTLQ